MGLCTLQSGHAYNINKNVVFVGQSTSLTLPLIFVLFLEKSGPGKEATVVVFW